MKRPGWPTSGGGGRGGSVARHPAARRATKPADQWQRECEEGGAGPGRPAPGAEPAAEREGGAEQYWPWLVLPLRAGAARDAKRGGTINSHQQRQDQRERWQEGPRESGATVRTPLVVVLTCPPKRTLTATPLRRQRTAGYLAVRSARVPAFAAVPTRVQLRLCQKSNDSDKFESRLCSTQDLGSASVVWLFR